MEKEGKKTLKVRGESGRREGKDGGGHFVTDPRFPHKHTCTHTHQIKHTNTYTQHSLTHPTALQLGKLIGWIDIDGLWL